MAPTTRLPPKKDVALALLEQASMYVHLDPRGEAVQVPLWFKKQPQLVLQVGLNMAVPIPDLHVDEQGLSCTLSFNRAPHFCLIPWASVFALVGANGQAMVWAEDVPAEVAAQAQKQPEKPRGGHLRSVGEAPAPSAPAPVLAAAAHPGKLAEKKKRVAPAAKAESAKETAAKPAPKKKAAAKPAATAASKAAVKPAAKKKAAPKPVADQPSAPKASPGASLAASKPPTPQAKPAQKQPAAEPSPASLAPNGKPKRELPPYLRVVK